MGMTHQHVKSDMIAEDPLLQPPPPLWLYWQTGGLVLAACAWAALPNSELQIEPIYTEMLTY